ncbi:hypothetical protein QTP70_008560 [Hemibagrus guttatus]|uniref:Endonuclease/exonuclease/phosphatase domain-containing protein n=1 Tax=Hemibagrus guttatus TaxID=175788 RepID=A0AAE0R757_9TELE|nr:hypothetical protein QTP70_008560 [Hemibagrus guttatus]
MERRKVDILCVQETRWKGSKARSIGAGFKLFYNGVDSKRNGVGVVLKEEFVRNVLEVKRVSDRVMSLKLEIEGVMLNVVSGYAPQVGCELEEKERFWSELDEVMESIPTGERVVIGADFNGHVGEGNTGDEEVMGKFGVKERNLEGQMVVDFAKRMDMGVVNTYFQKREEHRVTYKSGVMDQLSEEVRQESPWTMMFADDIVICSESREQVEENLESSSNGITVVQMLMMNEVMKKDLRKTGFSTSGLWGRQYPGPRTCRGTSPLHPTMERTPASDGHHPIGEGPITHKTTPLTLQIGTLHYEEITFYILSTPSNPVILGFPWLQPHNPVMAWKGRELTRWSPHCLEHCLRKIQSIPCHVTSIESPSTSTSPTIKTSTEVFSKEKAMQLPPHRPWNCAIELLPNAMPPKSRVYPFLFPENRAMEEYTEEALATDYIRPSTSPVAAGFFFVENKDGGLHPCIDYRGLSALTVR